MQTISQEERLKQDLRLYSVGICDNIRAEHLELLKDTGEWLSAEDEIIVADDTEQKYLYIIVEGEMEIFKFREGAEPDSPNERQVFSTLDAGNCFGEMAFLSAGIASANVWAKGRAILWRMSHEILLNYVEECKGGSQLVLNIAATLSKRVQEGNRRLLDVTSRIGNHLDRLKNSGSENTKELEAELSSLMNAYQGMEASRHEEDFKPLLLAAGPGVAGVLFGAWKFFDNPPVVDKHNSPAKIAPAAIK
ncbi:MAG: cyclic nucleotide-binding domain-containing protein [Opitutae bacterium]|nr:cyclic nucleotide-binding domain-containing protein [Opitutae bacterium]